MTNDLPDLSELPGEINISTLAAILDSLPEPRILMDREYRIVAANRAYQEAFGASKPIRGRHCFEVSHHFTLPCDQAGESCPLALARESGTAERVLHLHHTPRGEEHVLVETTPIHDSDGEVRYFVETLNIVHQASSQPVSQGMVGRSPAFRHMLDRLMRVAPSGANVLLLGETGTGKELAARVVHEASSCASGPFVAVDCSGLTETLFESELFGHEKGSFTGATQRKIGLVDVARDGTLFLDEIGDITLGMQIKLLRLLEMNTFRRVGGIETLGARFRLIAATHHDLPAAVRCNAFRRDLYYRISTFPVRIPSLAERRDDIQLLAVSLLERVDRKPGRSFSSAALQWLAAHNFEGNIRELRNLVERATLLADGNIIEPRHFEEEEPPSMGAGLDTPPFNVNEIISLENLERRYLEWVRTQPVSERGPLALKLGLSERTLSRKFKRLATKTPRQRSSVA